MRIKNFSFILFCLFSIVILTACAGSTTTESNNHNSTSTSVKPNDPVAFTEPNVSDITPKSKPDVNGITKHGGLGDTYSQMKSVLGTPDRELGKMKDGFGQYRYQGGLVIASFGEGRVNNIDYCFCLANGSRTPITEKEAQQFIQNIVPSDAKLLSHRDWNDGSDRPKVVYVYHSDLLQTLITNPDEYKDKNDNVHLGDFDVVLSHSGNKVEEIVSFTGDNP